MANVLAQQSTFRNFTTFHGLAALKVNVVHCDSEGRIWAATRKGISIYDGYSFQNLTLTDSLLDNDVRGIAEDSKGRIYLVSAGGIQCRQRGKATVSWRSERNLLPYSVLNIDEEAGLVYLCSDLSTDSLLILRLSSGKFEYQKKPSEKLSLNFFYGAGHLNSFGRIYQYSVQGYSAEEGFLQRDSLFFKDKYRKGAPFSVDNPDILIPLHNFVPRLIVSAIPNRHPEDIIFCDDRLLVVHDYANQLEHRYLLPRKPISFNSITMDQQGNVWIGSEQGLYKLFRKNIWHYNEAEGVPHMPWGVSELSREHYVISSYSPAPFHELRQGKITPIRNAPPNVYAYLNSRTMPGGKVLLTSSNGGFIYDGKSFERIDPDEVGMPDSSPAYLSSYVDSLSGDIMLGGVNLFNWFNARLEPQCRLAGATLNGKLGQKEKQFNVLAIAPVGRDTLLLGSSSGYIFFHKPTKRILRQHVFSDTLTNHPDNLMIWSAVSDYQNMVWCASTRQGSGLIQYNSRNDEFKQVAKGLISDNVSSVAIVNGGKVLLAGGSRQMLAIHLPRYYAGDKNCYLVLDAHNGLLGTEFVQNAIMQDSQGFIWVCTNDENIYKFRLNDDSFNLPSFKVSIRSVECFNQKNYNWEAMHLSMQDSSLHFDTSARSVRFGLSSVTQLAPEHLSFFYRIRKNGTNWPDEWQETTQAQFLLSEMEPGKYQIQLKCAYFYDSHSEEAFVSTWNLYFAYHWYETVWAQIVFGFLIIAFALVLFVLVVVWRDRRNKNREIARAKEMLEKTNLEIRAQAIEQAQTNLKLSEQNTRIGELYSQLSAYNRQLYQQKEEISTQAELLSDAYERLEIKNQEISFLKDSLEHDLKNNLLKMQNIASFPLESINQPEGKETFLRYQAELADILKTYRYMLAKEQHSASMLKELAEDECDRYKRPDIEVKIYCSISFERPEHRDRLQLVNSVVAELARNAAKHAFPLQIQNPQISFRIESDEENRIAITYQDNGIGIKDMASISTDAQGIALFRRVSIDQYFICRNQPDGGLYVAIRLANKPIL